jgi:putative endonuclease
MRTPPARRPGSDTTAQGRRAEGIAALYLEMQGYRILARNLRCGPGEIDLVAARGRTLAIIEVRLRASTTRGRPEESIGPRKRALLARAAELLPARLGLAPGQVPRFDAVAIEQRPFGLTLRHLQGYAARRAR